MWLVVNFFFFNDTATTEIYTLSLHDALPISNHIRGIGADRRNLGAIEANVVQRRADHARLDPLVHLDLHQRAAGELDAVVEAAGQQKYQTYEHDAAGQRKRPAAPLDEIVIRIREESDHQILRVTMSGRRYSQMRNSVFTTKIAEIIEAAIRMISVMAKPCTGPVPTA